ncbi:HlyD family secretion protein [Niabella hibiscisoli]|uniref:HlyD family secretion protein n=1 Tax=Niabella hibiscisoli TaxID=1825928 RepID=UPI001F0E97CF|nr:HlyD family secretion protein [Niabella hibiscisoli]MCH5717386.1 HlyD family secretion protein [Niabella hibiscisoli]
MNTPKTYIIYLTILVMVIGALISLPFISTTISTRANGITRPITERSEIRPVVSDIVEKLFYEEGQLVEAGAVIVSIKDEVSPVQAVSNNYDINQRRQFIHDLKILTASSGNVAFSSLSSALYKQQLNRFKYQLADQQASIKKVQHELDMNNSLLNDKVIAPKEAFDKQVESEKLQAAYEAFTRNQIAQWQQELANYEAELLQLNATGNKILAEKRITRSKHL